MIAGSVGHMPDDLKIKADQAFLHNGPRPLHCRDDCLMLYAIKEIFLTLKGEGAHVGRTAVFCRFAGCN
jgi:hypothetical protein